jgi:hypothetical protein
LEKTFSKQDTNIVKGVAIILLILHHCFLSTDRFAGYDVSFFPLSQQKVIYMAKAAKCCVGIFTFLSAYGLTCTFTKQEKDNGGVSDRRFSERFVLRRCFNLLSGFWAAYAVAFIGSCFLGSKSPVSSYIGEGESLFYLPVRMLLDLLGISRLIGTPALINTWWYMGLALTVILIFPFVYKLYRAVGPLLIPASFLLFCALGFTRNDFSRWIFLLPIGIWFADYKLLDKFQTWEIVRVKTWNFLIKFITVSACVVLSAMLAAFLYNDKTNNYTFLVDAVLAVSMILWVCFWKNIRVVSVVLGFLGKHSMNIFLLHNFLRVRWCPAHVFSFRHFALIVVMLLLESLLMSVVLEFVKKHSGYNRLVKKIYARI